MKPILAPLVTAFLLAGLSPAAAAPVEAPGRYIVVLHRGVAHPGAVAAEHARAHEAKVSHVYQHALTGYAAELSDGAVARIARDERVAYIERDQRVFALGEVPTGVGRVEADKKLPVSDDSSTSVAVDIAVLDTGIDASHPDLNVAGGWNCAKGGPFNTKCDDGGFGDGNGHGTHVAGTAAAVDQANGFGVAGVAPGARLWAVKVLANDGGGWISWIVAGVNKVTANADRIEVANMSLGCRCESQSLNDALVGSTNAGVVYVVAAGNDGQDAAAFSPANHGRVITVSAVADYDGLAGGGAEPTCRSDSGADDTFVPWSNYGAVVDIAAPGVCILSTLPAGGYGTFSGTSMASPHAAGAAALYIVENAVPRTGSRWSVVRTGLRGGGWSVPQADPCGFTGARSAEPFLMLAPCDSVAAPDVEAPAPPTGLTVADPSTGGVLNLDWADNTEPDLAGYHVYRSEDGGATSQKVATVGSSGYADSGLTDGTEYAYQVAAVDAAGNESAASAPAAGTPTDSVAPNAPSGLTAGGGDQSVALDWADNAEADLAGYHVHRTTDPPEAPTRAWTVLNGSPVASSTYTDTGLTNGVTYHYRVTAVDRNGHESGSSGEAAATPTLTRMHVHDLEGWGTSQGGRWYATVRISVFTSSEAPVSGASVAGAWSAGTAGGSCVTGGSGWCEVRSSTFQKGTKSVTYRVSGVSGPWGYEAGANHDADGDTDGTTIVVTRPG